jgi:hypothetical protein
MWQHLTLIQFIKATEREKKVTSSFGHAAISIYML